MTAEPLDTCVMNGRFVGPDAPADSVLTIHAGQIVAPTDQNVWRTIDASGHLVFPGLIQRSGIVHDNALAAVRAGVTTAVCDVTEADSACLDWIRPVCTGIPIVEPDTSGSLSDEQWQLLLSNCPVHVEGPRDIGFPVFHFLYHEGYVKRGMAIERIAEVTSGNLARRLGLFPGKGSFSEGSDGDLVVFDPESDDPYSDIAWPGRVIFSLMRGGILLYNGQIHTRAGDGLQVY